MRSIWDNWKDSRNTLINSIEQEHNRNRQSDLDAMNKKLFDQKYASGEIMLGEQRQAHEDKQGLRALESSLAQTPGLGEREKAAKRQGYLTERGMFDTQQNYAGMTDLTDKVDAQAVGKFKTMRDLVRLAGPDAAKEFVASQGQDPSIIDKIKFTPQYTEIPLEDGTSIFAYEADDGKTKIYQGKRAEQYGEPYTMNVGGRDVLVRKNLSTGKVEQVSSGPSPLSGSGGGVGDSTFDAELVADAIEAGRMNLSQVESRGGRRSAVVSVLEKRRGQTAPVDYTALEAENKGVGSSILQQEKQLGAMGSFVKNLDYQVNRVKELAPKLASFDTRLLNMPLRFVRGRIAGSPEQAIYDMYITEIENEIGKLATGSSASISELSVGAQEKWAKIHDKNLSINDMIKLLEESSHAGKMRMKSVDDQLKATKSRMRNRPSQNVTPQKGRQIRNRQTGEIGWLQEDGSILDADGRKMN